MEITFSSLEKIKSDKTINKASYDSAKRLWKDVKVDYITTKHVGFTCVDKAYNTSHSVIFFSEKKPDEAWNCDCHLYSIKKKLCKHILAVFIRLNKDESFLKTIKKRILD